jgi:hypothetical protein
LAWSSCIAPATISRVPLASVYTKQGDIEVVASPPIDEEWEGTGPLRVRMALRTGEAEWAKAWEEGRTMTLEEAVTTRIRIFLSRE